MTRDIKNMAIMQSIKPKYCELIISGKKTIELRKSRPKVPPPVKVYVYCTMPKCEDDIIFNDFEALNGKVIGEYICDRITSGYLISPWSDYIQKKSCLTYAEIEKYANNKPVSSWHISNLVIYNKPKELSEFITIRALDYDDWHYGLYDGSTTYEDYLAQFRLKRPPQSWCYVQPL